MKPPLDLVIVVPIGPTCKCEFIRDTIASIKHHIRCEYKIILADDSQQVDLLLAVSQAFPEVIVLRNDKNYGKQLGLYLTLCKAFRYALEHFDFKVLLRLDTDALVIGACPEIPILSFFRDNPAVGLAGRYVKGVRSPDEFGNQWMNGGRELIVAIAKIFNYFFLQHPIKYWRIRKVLFKAIHQGYELGELVFGGAYAFSRAGLEKLKDHALLPMKNVYGAELEEDHFFTLLIASVGMDRGDLASGELPFACTWKGLPASPETLVVADKKIIHSTRYWTDMNESEIRKYFRDKR